MTAVLWQATDGGSEVRVRPVHERYARLATDRSRYAQDDFEAELTVDEHGLVLDYEGLWRAIAVA